MNLFKKRMSSKGLSHSDRHMYMKQRDFEYWFNTTLNRYEVTIDGVKQYAVIQDHNQANNDNLSDDKFVITPNSSNIEVGSYLEWDGNIWLTFGEEHKTIQTHKQSKIRETNDTLRWLNKDGEISNNGDGYRCYVVNQTLYTLGVNTSGNHLWIADAQMMLFLPTNDEVENIKLGDRLFIGNHVYKVMFNDKVTRRGLSNFLVEQDMYNPHTDNIELGIADYYDESKKDTDDEDDNNHSEEKSLIIEGNTLAKVGGTFVYTARVMKDGEETLEGVTKWSVIDPDMAVSVVDQTSHTITLKVENNFSKVGSRITIVGNTEDGTTSSMSINIISPY